VEVIMLPDRHVWVFNSGERGFPGGVFTDRTFAEAWIAKHRLTGVLTAYPLDEGCYDFAVRNGLLSSRALEQNRDNPSFIGAFSSASLDHDHYEDGQLDS
jgi:hypothetical protein